MALRLQFSGDGSGAFERSVIEGILDPIKEAAEGAMREAADLIRQRGRQNIASAGFSQRWQEGFGVAMREPRGDEAFAISLQVFHRIGFASIFEGGGVIHGRPLLWLPIEANLPPRARGRRWTPRAYAREVGPLASVRGARRPLLVGRPRGRDKAVPVFFGVPSVTIPDKFDINEIVEDVMSDFERLYDKHLKID
jgi:hypothetical protein